MDNLFAIIDRGGVCITVAPNKGIEWQHQDVNLVVGGFVDFSNAEECVKQIIATFQSPLDQHKRFWLINLGISLVNHSKPLLARVVVNEIIKFNDGKLQHSVEWGDLNTLISQEGY